MNTHTHTDIYKETQNALHSCRLSCARFIYTHYDYTKKEFI